MGQEEKFTLNPSFLKAFGKTLVNEGGYTFDHADPGGETYMGISRVYWPNWVGWPVIDQANKSGRALSMCPEMPPMVRTFYNVSFWHRFRGNEVAAISEPVAMELFDTAVNQGTHTAVKYLQQALNLLNANEEIFPDIIPDGWLGQKTLTTLKLFFARRPMREYLKEKMLLNVMNTLQGMQYISLMREFPQKEKYRGWFLRL